MNQREKLHCTIQMYSFALDEIRLYLDTHPTCKNGLEYFHRYKKLYNDAVDEYVRLYGPLRADQVDCHDCWTWVNEPWPWERSAN